MPKRTDNSRTAGMSDEAVKTATGKTWAQWLKILDTAGARKMTHREIAVLLDKRYPEIGGWWCQMVTVGYEQARGMRQKHQKLNGFEIGSSKTVAVSVGDLYRAWRDKKARGRWLCDPEMTIRKATTNKSMRITWPEDDTSLSVNFYAKGRGKSQVALQHGKLANARRAARMKTYWSAQLTRLKEVLETT